MKTVPNCSKHRAGGGRLATTGRQPKPTPPPVVTAMIFHRAPEHPAPLPTSPAMLPRVLGERRKVAELEKLHRVDSSARTAGAGIPTDDFRARSRMAKTVSHSEDLCHRESIHDCSEDCSQSLAPRAVLIPPGHPVGELVRVLSDQARQFGFPCPRDLPRVIHGNPAVSTSNDFRPTSESSAEWVVLWLRCRPHLHRLPPP